MNRTLAPSLSMRLVNRLLAAACVVSALGLTACDAAVETAREAQRDADQAARIAGSAGQPRATEKLLDRVADTPLADRRTLAQQLGTGGDLITQQSAEKDLAKAAELINKAVKSGVSDNVMSSLQAEQAHITLTLASQKFNDLRDKLEDVARRAMSVQSSAQLAIDLGSEATAISASIKAPTTEEVDKAKTAQAAAQDAVNKADAEVKRLQQEIANRQEQARGIYSRTQAAFQAADQLKGKEAIDAGNKAIEESKQGDTLMAEAGNLEPQLAQARAALAIATIHAKDAERQVATATAAYEAGNNWVKQNTERINTLKDGAKKIVTGDKGVAEQYTQLVKAVTELEPLIKDAFDTAEQARNQYSAARTTNDRVLGALSAKASEQQLASDDSLVKVAKDTRASAVLSWGQAAAAEQAGRIQSAGYNAATMVSAVKTLVDKANQAAGTTVPQAQLPDRAAYQKAAATAFQEAADAAKAGNGATGPDADKIKWVGWTLQALANQGLSIVAPDAAANRSALTNAKDAAKNAVTSNPDLLPQLRRAGIDTAG